MTRKHDTKVHTSAVTAEQRGTGYCAVCGKQRVSMHSFPGLTQDTGAPVCFDCWARGYRASKKQEAEAPLVAESKQPIARRTGVFTAFRKGASKARKGHCDRCNALLPRSIARRKSEPHYCVACQEQLIREAGPAPLDAVSPAQAKALESSFLMHVDEGINRVAAWPGEKQWPKRRVRKVTQRSLPPLPEDYIESHPLQDALRKRLEDMPTRAYRRWDVRFGGRWPWQRNQQRISIVAAAWVPMREVLEQGYAGAPAGKRALIELAPLRSDGGNASTLLLAFSPTGWDTEAVPPPNTVLVSRAADGQWITRKGAMVSGMRTFAREIVTPPMEHSEVKRCMAHIETLPPARFPVSARSLVKEQGIAFETALEGMRGYAEANPSYLVCEDELRDDFLLEMRG